MIDPADEIATLGDAVAALRDAGVSDQILLPPAGICGAFGLDRITPTKAGLYEPAEDGADAIVIGARDHDDLADLVAWPVAAPTKFYRRIGAAVFLGEDLIEYAAFVRLPIQVFASPLSWLRAGCDGAVILDHAADLRPAFDGIPAIYAETGHLGNMIARQLRERTAWRLPSINVPEREGVAA